MKKTISIIVVLIIIAGFAWYFFSDSLEGVNEGADQKDEITQEVSGDMTSEEAGNEMPASVEGMKTYQGTLPAADGPGIETTLLLVSAGGTESGAFALTEVYLEAEDGENDTFTTKGQWVIKTGVIPEDAGAEVLVLTSREDESFGTRYYEIIDEDTIRVLATDKTRIESDLPYALELSGDMRGDATLPGQESATGVGAVSAETSVTVE